MRNLLAKAYSLMDVNERFGDEVPEAVPEFMPWIRDKGFPENRYYTNIFSPSQNCWNLLNKKTSS